MRCRPLLVLLALLALAFVANERASAADLPSHWCGADETAADRADAVASYQVHVLYLYPADGVDRFSTVATKIARDIAGIDAWWRLQDAGRAPRWDFASFPGCDSVFGALDISSVKLPQGAAAYAGADTWSAIHSDLESLQASPYKKYLVYYDGHVDTTEFCGVSAGGPFDTGGMSGLAGPAIVYLGASAGCDAGNLGDGNSWPARTATHELIHNLNPLFEAGTAPHACPNDPGHVCDNTHDILYGQVGTISTLGEAELDPGHDDYYGHGGAWPDVRNSSWLRHLDAPQYRVSLSVDGAGGTVASDLPGLSCPPGCSAVFDAGTVVTLVPQPADGFDFAGFRGACSGDSCSLTLGADASVTALFVRDVQISAKVVGKGQISGDLPCSRSCASGFAEGSTVTLRAVAAKGWRFTGWSGACRSKTTRCSFRAAGAARAVATFTKPARS